MKDLLQNRHIGISEKDEAFMLQTVGVDNFLKLSPNVNMPNISPK